MRPIVPPVMRMISKVKVIILVEKAVLLNKTRTAAAAAAIELPVVVSDGLIFHRRGRKAEFSPLMNANKRKYLFY